MVCAVEIFRWKISQGPQAASAKSYPSMKPLSRIVYVTIFLSTLLTSPFCSAARPGRVVVRSVQAGPTPFISFLFLTPDLSAQITRIEFTIVPKPGSVTRPVSITYSRSYLETRGFISGIVPEIMLPVFGLYANYLNTVVLTYSFSDGSTQRQTVLVPTIAFSDPCGFNNRTVLQARTDTRDLSYDYMLLKIGVARSHPRFWIRTGRFAGSVRLVSLTIHRPSSKMPFISATSHHSGEWNSMAKSPSSPTTPALISITISTTGKVESFWTRMFRAVSKPRMSR